MQRILLVLVDSASVLTLRRSVSTVAVWPQTAKLTRWGLMKPSYCLKCVTKWSLNTALVECSYSFNIESFSEEPTLDPHFSFGF